jgi:Rrf2 family protein
MADLARSNNSPRTIAEISAAQNIPKKFLEQILLQLKAVGLLTSKAGPKGGYMLAKPASSISLAELFSAIEEPICRQIPALGEGAAGSLVIQAVEDIRNYTVQRLSRITVKDLAEDSFLDHDVEALMYYI